MNTALATIVPSVKIKLKNKATIIVLCSLFVVAATLLPACKSKKGITNTAGANPNTKFDRTYIEACNQFNIGNYSTALILFQKCTELKPLEGSVYYQISRIKEKQNELDMALQMAAKANELAPDNKFYAEHYANRLLEIGQYEKAISILNICLKSNPGEERLYSLLDSFYELFYDKQKAIDTRINLWLQYKANAGLKGKTAQKLLDLYKQKKDYISAHGLYNELKTGAPNKVQYYVDEAILYLEENDEKNALLNYEKAISINPRNWEVNYALFQHYVKTGNKEKAIQYLQQGLQKGTASFEMKLPASIYIINLMKVDTVNNVYGRIVSENLTTTSGASGKAYYTAAEINYLCKAYSKSYDLYMMAAEYEPNLYDAWTGAIKSSFNLKNYEKAIASSEKAITYFANTAYLYERLATAYNFNKQYDRGFEYAVNGTRFAFDDTLKSQLYKQQAISKYFSGDFSSSKKAVDQAIAINSKDAELYNILGNILFKENNTDKALENWKKAKQMGLQSTTLDRKITDKQLYE